jgi:hypothetical protein
LLLVHWLQPDFWLHRPTRYSIDDNNIIKGNHIMMLAIDPDDEEFSIRVGTIVDVLMIVGGLSLGTTRDSALTLMLSNIAMTHDSKETLLLAMIEISDKTQVHYVDSRDDRIFFCDTVFGGAAYMMDCGEYRVFYHNEHNKLKPSRLDSNERHGPPPPLPHSSSLQSSQSSMQLFSQLSSQRQPPESDSD